MRHALAAIALIILAALAACGGDDLDELVELGEELRDLPRCDDLLAGEVTTDDLAEAGGCYNADEDHVYGAVVYDCPDTGQQLVTIAYGWGYIGEPFNPTNPDGDFGPIPGDVDCR